MPNQPPTPPRPDAFISADDMVACVERELRLRRQVYPRLVGQGRMEPAQAEHEIRAMQAVIAQHAGRLSERLL